MEMDRSSSRNSKDPVQSISAEIKEKIIKALSDVYGEARAKQVGPDHISVDSENSTAFVIHPNMNAGKLIMIDLSKGEVSCFEG